MPPDDDLRDLAQAYLLCQRGLWPILAEKGLLPDATTLALDQMVADFKVRHRTGAVDHATLHAFTPWCGALGGNYNRFSCDNSEPKSIADQMVESLNAAKSDGQFVPWAYVFADYSVSGLDSSRQGYNTYKRVLTDAAALIDTTYIADFSRASRDELEWWKLAALSKKLNKGLKGAEDHFNLNDPDWDMKLTMYGLLSRLLIKSLRQKVLRGMRSTARQGGSLGKPPLGYTRRVRRDEYGQTIVGRNDKLKKVPCIDPHTSQEAVQMFELFVTQGWTPYRIMKDFNRREVDGWSGWTERGIRTMLSNPAYVGVFIWNRTRSEFDWDKEKWVVVKNARSAWEVHYNPDLAIVPAELWRAARRKPAASRRGSANSGKSHPRRTATTLFSGTLRCGYRLYPLTTPVQDGLFDGGQADYVVRCEDYGVPQARHRIILLGVRDDVQVEPGALERTPHVPASYVLSGFPPLRSGLSKGDDEARWRETIQQALSSDWLPHAV